MRGWLVYFKAEHEVSFEDVYLNEADAIEAWEALRGDDLPVQPDNDYYIEEITVHNKL